MVSGVKSLKKESLHWKQNTKQAEMAESEDIQSVVIQAAILAATAVVKEMRKPDEGPMLGTNPASPKEHADNDG